MRGRTIKRDVDRERVKPKVNAKTRQDKYELREKREEDRRKPY